MNSSCRKLVLALALAVLPLQGVAATLTVLLCHGETQQHAEHADVGHDHGQGAAHAAHHGEAPTDDNAGASAAYHLCCNVTVSAPSAIALPAVTPDFLALAVTLSPLHDLFVPELPQRPPLA